VFALYAQDKHLVVSVNGQQLEAGPSYFASDESVFKYLVEHESHQGKVILSSPFSFSPPRIKGIRRPIKNIPNYEGQYWSFTAYSGASHVDIYIHSTYGVYARTAALIAAYTWSTLNTGIREIIGGMQIVFAYSRVVANGFTVGRVESVSQSTISFDTLAGKVGEIIIGTSCSSLMRARQFYIEGGAFSRRNRSIQISGAT